MSFEIKLNKVGKRYNREWIFNNVDYTFLSGNGYAILGNNGSGKSTLLQVVANSIIPSEGTIDYTFNNSQISADDIYKHLTIASPYLELIEEFTFEEVIEYQKKFKPFRSGLSIRDISAIALLDKERTKQIKYYSSGMKQRAKLALAILADTPLLLLDEPTSNLDKTIINWYKEIISEYALEKLVIVCSNKQEQEYFFAKEFITIEDYKIIA